MPPDAMIPRNGGVAELVECSRLEIGRASLSGPKGSNPFPSEHVDTGNGPWYNPAKLGIVWPQPRPCLTYPAFPPRGLWLHSNTPQTTANP